MSTLAIATDGYLSLDVVGDITINEISSIEVEINTGAVIALVQSSSITVKIELPPELEAFIESPETEVIIESNTTEVAI